MFWYFQLHIIPWPKLTAAHHIHPNHSGYSRYHLFSRILTKPLTHLHASNFALSLESTFHTLPKGSFKCVRFVHFSMQYHLVADLVFRIKSKIHYHSYKATCNLDLSLLVISSYTHLFFSKCLIYTDTPLVSSSNNFFLNILHEVNEEAVFTHTKLMWENILNSY